MNCFRRSAVPQARSIVHEAMPSERDDYATGRGHSCLCSCPKQGISFTRLCRVGEMTMRRDGDTAVSALAQSKEPKAQSVIATRGDYATVEARSDNPKVIRATALFKSCLRNQKNSSDLFRGYFFTSSLFTLHFSLPPSRNFFGGNK